MSGVECARTTPKVPHKQNVSMCSTPSAQKTKMHSMNRCDSSILQDHLLASHIILRQVLEEFLHSRRCCEQCLQLQLQHQHQHAATAMRQQQASNAGTHPSVHVGPHCLASCTHEEDAPHKGSTHQQVKVAIILCHAT